MSQRQSHPRMFPKEINRTQQCGVELWQGIFLAPPSRDAPLCADDAAVGNWEAHTAEHPVRELHRVAVRVANVASPRAVWFVCCQKSLRLTQVGAPTKDQRLLWGERQPRPRVIPRGKVGRQPYELHGHAMSWLLTFTTSNLKPKCSSAAEHGGV